MSAINTVTTTATGGSTLAASGTTGFGALGQGDFMKLLIAQLQQQDPTDPVDNKEMLVQMAQFSALAGTTEGNATLQGISDKLDALLAAQTAAAAANAPPTTAS